MGRISSPSCESNQITQSDMVNYVLSTLTNVTGQLLPALSSPFGPFLVARSRAIHSEFNHIFHCRYSAILYLRGRGGLLTRGGTLQPKIEVCGQQLVSPGGDQQIAAPSNCEPLFPSTYYHSHGIDGNRRWD